MAITITARKPRVSIVLAELPGAAGGGLVEPTEPGPWAQLPTVDPIRSATVVARPEAIRIESSFDTADGESPTWMLLDNRSDPRLKTLCAAKNLSWRQWYASGSRVVGEDAEMFVEGTRNRGMFSPFEPRARPMRCRGNDAI